MNLKQSLGVCFIIILGLASFKKSGNGINPKTPTITDVYAAGYIVKNGIYYAAYWKNGVTLAFTNVPSRAYSIAVSGNDVYLAGQVMAANKAWIAAYWKNGVVYKLADSVSSSAAYSIAVENNNVHVAGWVATISNFTQTVAVYWKNGVVTSLPNSANSSTATAIAISGSDVYISGYVETDLYEPYAVYWKNGALTPLAGSLNSGYQAYAEGIAVNSDNVFTAGYTFNGVTPVVAYWAGTTIKVNYIPVRPAAVGYAVALKGNDVYVVGDTLSKNGGMIAANCWKNDTTVNLANGGVGSDAHAIAVSGNDIYIGGFYGAHQIANPLYSGMAVYWKNGVAVQLSTEISCVNGLAIVVH